MRRCEYFQIATPRLYHGPEIATNALIEFYKLEERPNVKILDAGAGSGVLGPVVSPDLHFVPSIVANCFADICRAFITYRSKST